MRILTELLYHPVRTTALSVHKIHNSEKARFFKRFQLGRRHLTVRNGKIELLAFGSLLLFLPSFTSIKSAAVTGEVCVCVALVV